jgi:hypothetical protein
MTPVIRHVGLGILSLLLLCATLSMALPAQAETWEWDSEWNSSGTWDVSWDSDSSYSYEEEESVNGIWKFYSDPYEGQTFSLNGYYMDDDMGDATFNIEANRSTDGTIHANWSADEDVLDDLGTSLHDSFHSWFDGYWY